MLVMRRVVTSWYSMCCKRPPFGLQKTAFQHAIGNLSHAERLPPVVHPQICWMVLISRWLKYWKEHRPCRDIISFRWPLVHYVRTFRRNVFSSMFGYLYAPPWRAGIMNQRSAKANYAPTMDAFSLRLIVKNKVIPSNRFAYEPLLWFAWQFG